MFYKLDSTRATLREYWWGNRNPLVVIGWLLKLLRIPVPSSVDDPNVDSLEPFRISLDQLPEETRGRFHAVHEELRALGFHSPVCYWVHDVKHKTDIYQAVYLHESGQAFARMHYRMWEFPKPAKHYFFPVFLTAFTDDSYLISTAGKQDIMAPPNCRENRHVGMSATRLWESHRKALQEELLLRTVRPVRHERELIETIELHHATVRDFHVNRGVFVPMTADEEEHLVEAAQTAANADAEGESEAEASVILDEIEKLQNKRSGWGGALIVLLVSVGMFFALGAAVWPWEFVAMLLPILFLHELGHYVAMRLFRYSNVKMFFIPLLGAAVSGRHYNVPGWKKVVVSLAGPLPGIFLATGLGLAAAWGQIAWLQHAAMLAIFLNGFNLLPILPLDGGWIMHTLLFSRHYILDTGFRVLAVVLLLAGSYFAEDRFLFFFGLFMAMGLRVSVRMAGVVTKLRKQGIPATSPDGQIIPPQTALTIAAEIRSRFPHAMTDRNVAQLTLQAFEALNARPPGILATILLGGIYVGSFVFGIVALGVLAVGMQMFATMDHSAKHSIQADQIVVVGPGTDSEAPEGEETVVGTFSSADKAADRFDILRKEIPADATLVQFGRSLILAVPPGGPVSGAQWESRLASKASNAFSAEVPFGIGFSVKAKAPSEEVADRILKIMESYRHCYAYMIPSSPWHPDNPPTAEQQQARELFMELAQSVNGYDDPRCQQLNNELSEACENEDQQRQVEVKKELQALRETIRQEQLDKMTEEATEDYERALIEAYRRSPVLKFKSLEELEPGEPEPENVREARKEAFEEYGKQLRAWNRVLAELMGGQVREEDEVNLEANRFTMVTGATDRDGLTIEIQYLLPGRVVDAAPAFIRWLAEQGCTDIKYSLFVDD